jgi:hypothetical protein
MLRRSNIFLVIGSQIAVSSVGAAYHGKSSWQEGFDAFPDAHSQLQSGD